MFEFLLRHINLILGLTNIYAPCQDWHNAPISPIETFTQVNPHTSRNQHLYLSIFITWVKMALTRCLDLYLFAQWFSICQMSRRWMRRESEAIETQSMWGSAWHWAESRAGQHKQDDRRRAERRINPRYHELFRAGRPGESWLVLWAHCALGGEHNVQHMAWWYNTIAVWEEGRILLLVFFLCWILRADLKWSPKAVRWQSSRSFFSGIRVRVMRARQEEGGKWDTWVLCQGLSEGRQLGPYIYTWPAHDAVLFVSVLKCKGKFY